MCHHVRRLLLVALAVAASTAISAEANTGATTGGETYRNPVLNRDFPDPTVRLASDGWYYAYATEGDPGGVHVNIQTARSRDLVHWSYLGDALPHLPGWGNKAQVSWAPDVVERNGRYFLYYSIVPNRLLNDFGLCLAVATSKSPAGPFITARQPLYCGPTEADIDGGIFHDPATGKWLVYWGSGGDIVTAELAPSMLRLGHPDAQPKLLLRGWSSPIHRPYEHGIEGPFVVRHGGWYYLFYSGDNCCSYPPHYATMVARSRSATGPFTRLAATRPGRSSVIMHSNWRWKGPGHVSVIRDAAGHDWLVHHAIDARHPYLPGGGVRRPMLLERIVYRDGWPTIRRNSPAVWQRAAPVA